MTRKICLVLLVLCLAVPSLASASTAKERLELFINDALVILQDPAYANKDPEKLKEQRDRLEVVIDGIFDYALLSQLTVGKPWATFSPDQQEEFIKAFKTLLEATYLGSLRGGGSTASGVDITGESDLGKGKIEITTQVNTTDKEIPIAYRMIESSDWMVYDVIVEGVSLVKNYRDQFRELLVSKTPDEVIAAVWEKANKKRESEAESAAGNKEG